MGTMRPAMLFLIAISLPLFLMTPLAFAEALQPGPDTTTGAPLEVAGTSMQAGGVEGGQESLGCLGCAMTLWGTVLKVFPESDLNRFGIVPKDKFLSINGHPFRAGKFQKECVGTPGTDMQIGIIHNGVPEEITVQRVDASLMSKHAKRYKKLAAMTKFW